MKLPRPHPITLLLMGIATLTLLLANLRSSKGEEITTFGSLSPTGDYLSTLNFVLLREQGWPWVFRQYDSDPPHETHSFSTGKFSLNIVVGLLSLTLFGFICEKARSLPPIQLRLSTLLIVSLLASGLVWLNVRSYRDGPFYAYGWPMWRYSPWDWNAFAVNIAICLSLLTVATFAIEWLTRRLKRGAP